MKTILYILLLALFNGGSRSVVLQNYLQTHLKGYDGFSFEVVRKAPSNFNIDPNREFRRQGRFGYVPIVEHGNRKTYLTVKLKLFKNCYIARETIKKGEALERDLFETAKVDVAGFVKKPVKFGFRFGKYRSKSIIKKGTVLFGEDVEPVPIVKSGMPVKAKFISGNVMIEFRAIAQQDGWKDRIIKIKAANKKIYSAKVIDSNNVLITE